jgi:hypothetical protein
MDLVRARWSRYRTIHDAEPRPRFDDVLDVRVGAEWTPLPALDLRGGYAYEPTPVPPQSRETNLFDADRHVIAIGAGLRLGSMRIDAQLRTHVLGTHEAVKETPTLPDDDPTIPGRQIKNFGYPSISASGSFWQMGLTLVGTLPGAAQRSERSE